mmetsp:Transcript_14973/g.20940  ORF Transcript_14973/g.20940 Transcript_14973/m.20940 type:complete len:214 (+) Transcript_14973:390-1031(+)
MWISSIVLLQADNIIQFLGVSVFIFKHQMTNQFGIEVVHFNSTVVVNFDVNLSSLSSHVTVLVHPCFALNWTSWNDAASSNFNLLVEMLSSDCFVQFSIDNKWLLDFQVWSTGNIDNCLNFVLNLGMVAVLSCFLLSENTRQFLRKVVLERISVLSCWKSTRVADQWKSIFEKIFAGFSFNWHFSGFLFSSFFIPLSVVVHPLHLFITLDFKI